MEKIILVHYIDIRGMESNQIHENMMRIRHMLSQEGANITNFIIPVRHDTKIECLNPKLVSEEDYKHAKEVLERNQKIVDDIISQHNVQQNMAEGPTHSEK